MSTIKRTFFPIFAVLFLGYLGFSLALPLFPPLFLDQDHTFLPRELSQSMRRIFLGLLFAMYPSGQFIGSPLLGKFSDKYGRKPVLLTSLLAIIPAYVGCALSIVYTLPSLLFLSRFLCGLFEGNVVIAQAAIADTSENQKAKIKRFGWLVSLSSLAFFFGPLIGSALADSKLISWFHYDTPFWVAAFLVLIGFFVVLFIFKETHKANVDQPIDLKNMPFFFTKGFKLPGLNVLFSAHLFIFFAMFFFFNFFSAFLVNRFDFTLLEIGQANAYLSLFLIVAPFVFRQFSRTFPPHKTLIIGAFSLGVSFIFFTLPFPKWSLFITLIPIGIFLAVGFAFPAILVSELVNKGIQGQALGMNMSIQMFAESLTAVTGGFLLASWNSLPLITGGCCSWIGGGVLIWLFRHKKAISAAKNKE